ncbi:hypothetical protein BJY00DRAFT_314996 [Aspergillus carlsbadensis]|nr:hypothetical protein BJY00DRAFT_314996 [Aspergillus carlsbadensis]
MDDFLSSIPAVQKLLESEDENQRPKRFTIFQAIRAALERRLALYRKIEGAEDQSPDRPLKSEHHTEENDEQKWIAELEELDLGDTDIDAGNDDAARPNSIKSMAWLLTRYVVNSPWIPMPTLGSPPDEEPSDTTGDSSKSSVEDQGYPSPSSHRTNRGNKSLLDYTDLADMLAYNGLDDNPGKNGITYVALNELIPGASKMADLIASSDHRLGLAGFLPVLRGQPAELVNIMPEWEQDEVEDDLLSQWRGHTRLTGHSARVCLLPYSDSLQGSNYDSLVDRINRSLNALNLQIGVLNQVSGNACNKLHFARIKAASGEEDSQCHAEIYGMDVRFIEGLVGNVANILLNPVALISDVPALIAHTLLQQHTKMTYELNITDQFSMYCRHWAHSHSFGIDHSDFLSPLLFALRPILEVLGIHDINVQERTQHPSVTALHFTALAAQSLTLIVQSNLRGLTVPCQFEFLTSTVSDFVLEGANHSLTARKVFASSQKLSCLGDMLEKEVLVFGLKERDSQYPMDIVATPAQIAEIWGPAELVVRKFGPSSAKNMSIKAIRIRQGFLIPVSEPAHGIQKWHWLAGNRADVRILTDDACTGVDLHTRVRIGAKDYPGLRPIGPARLNEKCPLHGVDDFICRYMDSQSLRPLGVRDPVLEWRNLNVGVQAGQGAIITAQGALATKPGVTMKDKLLGFGGPFNVRMAELDRIWGLAVSLCTGVMTRVRLRDLVGFYCLKCSNTNIPSIQGQDDRQASLNGFAQAMSGHNSLCTWIGSLVPPSNNTWYHRREIERHIQKLFSEVLEMLKDTGIQDDGDLAVACISQSHSLGRLTISAKENPWIQVLKDSASTATFACALPRCFEIDDCACWKSQCQLPKEYRLSTKLDIFTERQSESKANHKLRVGKSYRINSANLNMTAKIHHHMKSSHGNAVYYATIKKSVLKSAIFEYVSERSRWRENDSMSAVQVVIGGGPQFLGRLEQLQQNPNPSRN